MTKQITGEMVLSFIGSTSDLTWVHPTHPTVAKSTHYLYPTPLFSPLLYTNGSKCNYRVFRHDQLKGGHYRFFRPQRIFVYLLNIECLITWVDFIMQKMAPQGLNWVHTLVNSTVSTSWDHFFLKNKKTQIASYLFGCAWYIGL